MCGELAGAVPGANTCHGSSPRVRGTRRGRWAEASAPRFIPACAGNSSCVRPSPANHPVHPRVCGELDGAGFYGAGAHRFIPACAGNSLSLALISRLTAVHPRVCGELENPPDADVYRAGSSPRVRGTPGRQSPSLPRPRFIPACAGNSETGTEYVLPVSGSSPRVRGTRDQKRVAALQRRFIPACAGNSSGNALITDETSVHPRVCGELRHRTAGERQPFGSSPRVRGTRSLRGADRLRGRFIPACAGNSRQWHP